MACPGALADHPDEPDHPALFSAAVTAWVRGAWPDRPGFAAIDGKTSRRSHGRATETAPIHLVSAFATTSYLSSRIFRVAFRRRKA